MFLLATCDSAIVVAADHMRDFRKIGTAPTISGAGMSSTTPASMEMEAHRSGLAASIVPARDNGSGAPLGHADYTGVAPTRRNAL